MKLNISSLVDGREIVPMKESQLVEQCHLIKAKGLKNVNP